MRSYIKMTIFVAICFLIGIVILIVLTGVGSSEKNVNYQGEISALNDIAKNAEANRSNLQKLDSLTYDMDLVIVDMTENILYAHTSSDISKERLSVQSAIQNRYPYIYLKDDNQIWGCLIELDDGLNRYRKTRSSLIIGVCIFSALVILGIISYGIYIDKNIVVPFRKMKAFASKVAQWNFDEPLEMDKDNMFGSFSESFDIMREELAESRKRELELQKKEKELVASLSHDLKTPITGIKLTADFMAARLQAWTQPEQKEHTISDEELTDMLSDAVKIAQKTEQIDTLVTDLFNSTLDELGEIRVVCADEAASVLGELVQDFDNKDKVVMEAIPEVIISIDRKRMTQVIGNIISNSYKYADTRIDISYEINEGYLEMNIRDYGPGVPANELDLITNKFYRGKDWIDKDKDGNGLGLYIAKTLMNKMKGDLITESPGEGLEVKLVIPLS